MIANVAPLGAKQHRPLVCDTETVGSLIRSALPLGGDRPSLVEVFADVCSQHPDWAWSLAQVLAADNAQQTTRLLGAFLADADRLAFMQAGLVDALSDLRAELLEGNQR